MAAVKLKDIAKYLNTSIVTVSNALSGKKGVSSSMREAVIQAAAELGYDVTKYQERRKEKNVRFGVLLSLGDPEDSDHSDKSDAYEWMLCQQAVCTLSERKIPVLLKTAQRQTQWDMKLLEEWSSEADGLLVIGNMDYTQAAQLRMLEKPVVLLGFQDDGYSYDAVMPNDYLGVCRATVYLLERGYEDISFVYSCGMEGVWEWYAGFCRGMETYGRKAQGAYMIRKNAADGNADSADLTDITNRISSGSMPDAVVCAGIQTAELFYKMFGQNGYRIPKDVPVIVYDRVPVSCAVMDPVLKTFTCCSPDLRFMAESAADILIRRKKDMKTGNRTIYADSRVT